MRDVGGNWIPGITSQMFRKRMNKKSVPRNGVKRPASCPTTSLVMPLSTNS